MGFDGAGSYDRQRNFSADASADIKILASAMDQEFDDFASAMTLARLRDGQNEPTADLPMGGFKHVNVGAPASATNYMRSRDFINNVPIYMIDSESSADRISVSAQYFTTASANEAPVGGVGIRIKMGSDKGSAPAIQLNTGDGNPYSANVVLQNGSALYSGAIISGGVYDFIFASAASVWHLMNPSFLGTNNDARFAATTADAGLIEIATTAEADTGTDTSKAITPRLLSRQFSADAATTASAGLIEIATTAEVSSGTGTNLAVTPAALAATSAFSSANASAGGRGIIELAATSETILATDQVRAITPRVLGRRHMAGVFALSSVSTEQIRVSPGMSAWTASSRGSGVYVIEHDLALSSEFELAIQVTPRSNVIGRNAILYSVSVSALNKFGLVITTADGTPSESSTTVYINILRLP